MSDEAKAETFTMTLAGRVITFRKTNLGQVIMLQRRAMRSIDAAKAQDAADGIQNVSHAMVEVLDFIDAQIVDPDDRQFVEDQMLAGNILWEELMGALGGGSKDAQDDDKAPADRKPPKKSPKAATKTTGVAVARKSVANNGRTKR